MITEWGPDAIKLFRKWTAWLLTYEEHGVSPASVGTRSWTLVRAVELADIVGEKIMALNREDRRGLPADIQQNIKRLRRLTT